MVFLAHFSPTKSCETSPLKAFIGPESTELSFVQRVLVPLSPEVLYQWLGGGHGGDGSSPILGKLHIKHTMWGPQDISWFRSAPVTVVINTMSHSEIGVICTNLYLGGLTLYVNIYNIYHRAWNSVFFVYQVSYNRNQCDTRYIHTYYRHVN